MVKNSTKNRDRELRRRFRTMLNSGVNRQYCNWEVIVRMIAGQPAPCFYICPKKAEHYVLNYFRGVYIKQSPLGMAMIKDLAENYEKLKAEHPDKRQFELWDMLVDRPAKSFYLNERTIKRIVYEYLRATSVK